MLCSCCWLVFESNYGRLWTLGRGLQKLKTYGLLPWINSFPHNLERHLLPTVCVSLWCPRSAHEKRLPRCSHRAPCPWYYEESVFIFSPNHAKGRTPPAGTHLILLGRIYLVWFTLIPWTLIYYDTKIDRLRVRQPCTGFRYYDIARLWNGPSVPMSTRRPTPRCFHVKATRIYHSGRDPLCGLW